MMELPDVEFECLSNDIDDQIAFLKGAKAMSFLEGDRLPLSELLELARSSKRDPVSAFNLGVFFDDRAKQTGRRSARETANALYRRCVDIGKTRIDRASPDVDLKHNHVADMVSRALVNLGNYYQYELKQLPAAYENYRRAATLFDNPIAVFNVAQMNFWGLIPNGSGRVALEHYRRARALGKTCVNGRADCDCMVGFIHQLESVPAEELEAALPGIRGRAKSEHIGALIPLAQGVSANTAERIDLLLKDCIDVVGTDGSVVGRVFMLASLLATVVNMEGIEDPRAVDDRLMRVVEAMRGSYSANPLMADHRNESANYEECVRYSKSDETIRMVGRINRVMMSFSEIMRDENYDIGVTEQMLRAVLFRSEPGWRRGLVQTACGAFYGPPYDLLRLAMPGGIGDPDMLRSDATRSAAAVS